MHILRDLLNVSLNLTEGKPISVLESYDLRVTGAPAGVELWRGEVELANGSAAGEYNFLGLERGLYSIKSGGMSWQVLVNGNAEMDLSGKAPFSSDMKMIGIKLILAINLMGVLVIIRIIRKEE